MTVIVAQLQIGKSIHCTDSLLTSEIDGKRKRASGSGMPKILVCPAFKGAISWWGLVGTETWNAKEWLIDVIARLEQDKDLTVDSFASSLADELTYLLRESHIERNKGVGLHFTTLEDFNGEFIPELFLITNYAGMEYQGGPKFVSHRQTFHTLSENSDTDYDSHHLPFYRNQVLEYLRQFPMIYSNGQPRLFGALAPDLKLQLESISQEKQRFWQEFPYRICKKIAENHNKEFSYDQRLLGGPFWETTTTHSKTFSRRRF